MKNILALIFITISFFSYAQVDTTFIYNTNAPYGTLDIRISKSATRYYYLEENRTVSFRENASGAKTDTFLDMTSWDSSPYTEGNLREKNGSSNTFLMNYRLLFPVGYQPNYTQGYPLIVMMHGAGERANCWDDDCYWADRSWKPSSNNPPAPGDSDLELLNNDHNMSHGGKPHLDARNRAGAKLPDDPSLHARAFPGFVLFGQNLNGWDTNSTQDMIRLIRLAVKKYNIDPNKIYIHGLSNGAIAVYNVLKRAPWLFAAALPMSAPTDAGITSSATLTPTVAHIPLWIFQGGQDTEPAPNRTEGYIRKFREAGADVRYSLYPNLGHGTWNAAYAEPEFFSWMRSKDKTQVHVFFNNPTICPGTGGGVKLGLAAGFLAYQWQKNGQNIAGATGPEYVATQPGVYRARFSRESVTPGSSEWEKWSQNVTITLNTPVKANIIPLTTTHLRGPDNAGPNTIRLKSVTQNDQYHWYKNGVRINIPNNSADDTVRTYTITGTSTNNNGAYTLVTATQDGCPGMESDPVNLFFSNSAPLLPDGNIPGSFSLVSATGSTANFSWADRSSVETAYEIWRRAPGESFILAGRTPANATSFNDMGLVSSTTYDYKIRVVNNQGRSRYAPSDNVSTNLQVTTQGDNVPPTAPQNLKVVRNTTSSISLSWTASTDNNGAIKHYVVYYGSESKVTGSNDPFYTLADLPINQSYTITVKAVDNADLFSAASNQVTGTTSVTGLWYGHSTGAWTDLDQINWSQPEYTGTVPNFTLEPRTQEEFFNFEFTGYLYINSGGTYYFYLNSNDGSRLYIDGNQIVDFDGVHGISGANEGFGVKSAAVALTPGAHDIRVIFFENTGGQSLSVAYQGADSNNAKEYIPDEALTSGDPGSGEPGPSCAGTGTIIREVWTGITGKEISSIPVNSPPSSTSVLTIFEGPFRVDDNYGARIRGYICVPETGDYTFWIASDDRSELWLSTNDNPGSKVLIANVAGATSKRQWDKYASQQSSPIHLTAEQKYYIEALHKESVTYDHVAVGWQLPGGTLERPIPGMRLMPYESQGSSAPVVDIDIPEDGQNFSAPASVSISADASTADGNITKVEFYNGTTKLGEDATSPYNYTWSNVSAGDYTLVAKAIDNTGAFVTDEVNILVASGSSCAGTGTVLREVWTGIQYADVASIPVNSSPDGTSELTLFEDPSNAGDNYGTRVSGYLCVPETGAYTFWISSNDHSELWLSSDDNPANKSRIAFVTGYTNVRQWTKFNSQQSSAIDLVAGQRYYIEALHKEGVGSDHMAVGWQLPGGTLERPIPGNRLSPFGSEALAGAGFMAANSTASQTNNVTASADGNTGMDINIFPNPVQSGVPGLTISAYRGVQDATEITIEIVRMTGEVVHSEKVFCEANCDTYPININQALDPGVYLISVSNHGKRSSKRLMVK